MASFYSFMTALKSEDSDNLGKTCFHVLYVEATGVAGIIFSSLDEGY
jgi:hypothetical protein